MGSKYLNFGGAGSGFIVSPFAPFFVDGFQITTANDAPGRDPASFELYGFNGALITTDSGPSPAINQTGLAEAWTLISSGPLSLDFSWSGFCGRLTVSSQRPGGSTGQSESRGCSSCVRSWRTWQLPPAPVFGTFDQAGPEGVAFDVAEDGHQVLVLLDGETLEAALPVDEWQGSKLLYAVSGICKLTVELSLNAQECMPIGGLGSPPRCLC